jgi:hypothetical protein
MKLQQNKRWSYDKFTDDAEIVWNVHKNSACEGESCVIHNPSDHHLKDAKVILRSWSPFSSKPHGFAERFCPHGIGHSDPDSVAFYARQGVHGMGIHGCDGCCNGTYEEIQNATDVR